MGTKFGLLLRLGIEYVFGTHAGREQYEGIRLVVSKIRRFPVAARPLGSVGEKTSSMVHARDEHATSKVTGAVKKRLLGAPAAPYRVDLRFENKGPNSR